MKMTMRVTLLVEGVLSTLCLLLQSTTCTSPVSSQNVIRTVQVDQYANMPVNAPSREQRYTVAPTPNTATAQEFDPDDDNFGFNETTSFFEDAKNYNPTT